MQRLAKPPSRPARGWGFESPHFRCGGSSTGRAPGCDPGGCGFKSRPSPQHCQAPVAQRTEHRPPAAKAGGSSPPGGTQPRPRSSTGKSSGLRSRRLLVRIQPWAPRVVPVAQPGRGGRLKPGVGAGSTPAGDTVRVGQSTGLLHRNVRVRLPPRTPTHAPGARMVSAALL